MSKHIVRIRYRRNLEPASVRRYNFRVVDSVSGFFAEDTRCAKIDGQYIDTTRFLPDINPITEKLEP